MDERDRLQDDMSRDVDDETTLDEGDENVYEEDALYEDDLGGDDALYEDELTEGEDLYENDLDEDDDEY